MKRFHRAMSITLLALGSLILIVEFFRVSGLYPRTILVAVVAGFGFAIERLCTQLSRIPKNINSEIQGTSRPAALSHYRPPDRVVSPFQHWNKM